MKRLFSAVLLIMAAIGFLAILTGAPAAIAQGGGTYCDDGKTLYCWTSLPYWQCLTQVGGVNCADKPKGI